MLLVAKTVTFDHCETQPAGGIVPRFTDSLLSYMVLRLYPGAKRDVQMGKITVVWIDHTY